MEKGPLALKYLGHMSAKGLGESEDHDEVSDDLQNAKRCHVYSSFNPLFTEEGIKGWSQKRSGRSKA
jgi:hypothetical protein